MKNSKPTPRNWRLNYIIAYTDEASAYRYRSLVLNALENVAALRKIDYAIMDEYPFDDENPENQNKQPAETVEDLVCFRSSTETLSSITEFRKLIELMFQGHNPYSHMGNQMPFGVYALAQKLLPKYPFPENDYYHPLEYPYMDYHKDGKVTLCIPASTVEQVIDEMNEEMN